MGAPRQGGIVLPLQGGRFRGGGRWERRIGVLGLEPKSPPGSQPQGPPTPASPGTPPRAGRRPAARTGGGGLCRRDGAMGWRSRTPRCFWIPQGAPTRPPVQQHNKQSADWLFGRGRVRGRGGGRRKGGPRSGRSGVSRVVPTRWSPPRRDDHGQLGADYLRGFASYRGFFWG